MRVTIVLDDNLASKLRDLQAAAIKAEKKNYSFSAIINAVIEKGLKKSKS